MTTARTELPYQCVPRPREGEVMLRDSLPYNMLVMCISNSKLCESSKC